MENIYEVEMSLFDDYEKHLKRVKLVPKFSQDLDLIENLGDIRLDINNYRKEKEVKKRKRIKKDDRRGDLF